MNYQFKFSNNEIAFIFNKFELFLKNNIKINIGKNISFNNIKLYLPNKDNKFNLMFLLEHDFDWDFTCELDNKNIKEVIGYPWCISPSMFLKSYCNDRFNYSDLIQYFELLEQNLPKLKELILEKYEGYIGSKKWLMYANKWANYNKNILSTAIKNISIVDMEISVGTAHSPTYKITYTFSKELDYYQKMKIEEVLNRTYLERYNNLNNSTHSSFHTCAGISYHFFDNRKNAICTNKIKFYLKSNRWDALGMYDEAKFIPILGKKNKN